MDELRNETDPQSGALQLRVSPVLSRLPASAQPPEVASFEDAVPAPQRAATPASAPPSPVEPAPVAVAAAPPDSPIGAAQAAAPGAAEGPPTPRSRPPISASTWGVAGFALLATAGWLYERRRRKLGETEKDSVMWANVQPRVSSIITTAGGLDDILPDSPDPAESARAIYVTAIGETNSRREATLIDLHQLGGKLTRRKERGDVVAAVLLLQQHLVDFRFTSPWVFLELRELYKQLDRQKEWSIAREAFRARFGQNAPAWTMASTLDVGLDNDPQLCAGLIDQWPYREARMFILRWMLGEHEMRHKSSGPPLLPLGVYRDLMFLDTMLDEVMITRPQPMDSLL